MIENTFFKSMDSLGPFENKPNLAIGVSGGSDSLFLTLLTNEWVKKKNGKLTALVVDHNLRKQSKYECKIIQKILDYERIPHHSFRWNKKKKLGIQKAARDFRYLNFEEWCFKNNIFNLLVAHHFDDQKETFLIRLNSNSNPYGLSCMNKIVFKQKIRILRPLLDFNKKDIIKYLNKKKKKWVEDETNKLPKYTRNRYRIILPSLEDNGLSNKKFKNIFNYAQKKRKLLENKSIEWLAKNIEISSLGYVSILLSNLLSLKKDKFIFIFNKILVTISGSYYPPKTKHVYNFYKKIQLNKIKNGINLGGCHIFFKIENDLKKIFICREIVRDKVSLKLKLYDNRILWDNRFEASLNEKDFLYFSKKLGKSLFIEQLKLKGWEQVCSKNNHFKKVHKLLMTKTILPLPALKNKHNDVLCIPNLNYYVNNKSKNKFLNINFNFKPLVSLSNFN